MSDNPFADVLKEKEDNTDNPFSDVLKNTDNPFSNVLETESDETFMEAFARRYEGSPRAIAETITTLGSGIVSTIGGGLAGLNTIAANTGYADPPQLAGQTHQVKDINPADVVKITQEAGTYIPSSRTGQELTGVLAYPFEQLHKGARWAGENVFEITGSVPLATATETVLDFLPWLFLPKVISTGKTIAGNVGKVIKPPLHNAANTVRGVITPISGGGAEGRIAAKSYANMLRGSDALRNHTIENLRSNFSIKELEQMGNALIAEELAFKLGRPTSKGVTSLSVKQQEAVHGLMERHRPVAEKAVELGILGHSSDIYFPRKVIGELGEAAGKRIYGDKTVRTTTKHAKKRKYLHVEHTVHAAQARFGESAEVARDIRVLPLVTAELERAIAGRLLIREIEGFSKELGLNTVTGRKTHGYFTIDHPAFYRQVPRLRKLKNGKYRPVYDEHGKVVFGKEPIYIHESFQQPLKAIFADPPGPFIGSLYKLKAKSMSAIMFSPVMHGAVLWGKALPFMPMRSLTFRNYYQGHKFLNDVNYLKKHTPYQTTEQFITAAAKDGLAEMNAMGWVQRISDVMERPHLEAGRSWTAQSLGGAARIFGKGAQHKTKLAVDAAGRFWHDTLLWNRVRDAQYGMYQHLKTDFIKQGANEVAAGQVAAHLSNRFAGAIPLEDMGATTRAILNITLFSRSFNATNMGIYKDALSGLPRAVQDIILKSGSKIDLQIGQSALKQAGRATLVKDIVAMYILNSLAQNMLDYMRTGDAGEIAQGYADRWDRYTDEVKTNPLAAIFELDELSATAENEPGKEERVYIGDDPSGRGIYMKNVLGKIGEDLVMAGSAPVELLSNKLSPTANFVSGMYFNDKSGRKKYGLPIYAEHSGWEEVPNNIGKIVHWFFEAHLPLQYVESVVDYAFGNDPSGVNKLRAFAQPIGGQFSRGAPGGPTRGLILDILDAHQEEMKFYSKRIRKLMDSGETEKAINVMINEAGMSGLEAKSAIERHLNPAITRQLMEQVMSIATQEERDRIQRSVRRQYGSE